MQYAGRSQSTVLIIVAGITLTGRVQEDEHQHRVTRLFRPSDTVASLSNGPCGVHCEQATRTQQIHLPSRKPWCDARHDQTDEKAPALLADVVAHLFVAAGDSNLLRDGDEVLADQVLSTVSFWPF